MNIQNLKNVCVGRLPVGIRTTKKLQKLIVMWLAVVVVGNGYFLNLQG